MQLVLVPANIGDFLSSFSLFKSFILLHHLLLSKSVNFMIPANFFLNCLALLFRLQILSNLFRIMSSLKIQRSMIQLGPLYALTKKAYVFLLLLYVLFTNSSDGAAAWFAGNLTLWVFFPLLFQAIPNLEFWASLPHRTQVPYPCVMLLVLKWSCATQQNKLEC